MQEHIGWIVDADVSAFFDSLDHDLLCEVLRQRVNDGAILCFDPEVAAGRGC